jgi:hypothetical protein
MTDTERALKLAERALELANKIHGTDGVIVVSASIQNMIYDTAALILAELQAVQKRSLMATPLSTSAIKELLSCSAELRNYVLDLSATIQAAGKPEHWPSWQAKAEEMERNWHGATETHQQERQRADKLEAELQAVRARTIEECKATLSQVFIDHGWALHFAQWDAIWPALDALKERNNDDAE